MRLSWKNFLEYLGNLPRSTNLNRRKVIKGIVAAIGFAASSIAIFEFLWRNDNEQDIAKKLDDISKRLDTFQKQVSIFEKERDQLKTETHEAEFKPKLNWKQYHELITRFERLVEKKLVLEKEGTKINEALKTVSVRNKNLAKRLELMLRSVDTEQQSLETDMAVIRKMLTLGVSP